MAMTVARTHYPRAYARRNVSVAVKQSQANQQGLSNMQRQVLLTSTNNTGGDGKKAA